MMIDMMLHHLQTLAIAMVGLGPVSTPAAAPSPMVACTTSVTVSSSISSNQITVTARDNSGKDCLGANACVGNSTVNVTYDTSSDKYTYLDVSGNLVVNTPPTTLAPTAAGGTIDFAVVGDNDGTLLWVPDPKITVKTGTCSNTDR